MRLQRRHLDFCFVLAVWLVWTVITCIQDWWILFGENWFMSVTMAFGSFVAGATSQGGGAVAFPVMTLGFGIEPKPARDFSLMIQTVGMSSAAVAIWANRIKVEKTALIYSGIGGILGIFLSLSCLQIFFTPNPTKVFFVALWLAFGVALVLINRDPKAAKLEEITKSGRAVKCLLFAAGVLGGILSGLLGSGLDIMIFAVLVLGFRICEKIATPTSVVLMAGNSLAGFLIRLFFCPLTGAQIAESTWNYWWVSVPVVAFGAPFGARFIARRGRKFIVRLLLAVILAQFIAALIVVPFDRFLITLAAITFCGGSFVFWVSYRLGDRSQLGLD